MLTRRCGYDEQFAIEHGPVGGWQQGPEVGATSGKALRREAGVFVGGRSGWDWVGMMM